MAVKSFRKVETELIGNKENSPEENWPVILLFHP
jgi:hypothetical protein